jgi:flagellar biogenesis protein FliO
MNLVRRRSAILLCALAASWFQLGAFCAAEPSNRVEPGMRISELLGDDQPGDDSSEAVDDTFAGLSFQLGLAAGATCLAGALLILLARRFLRPSHSTEGEQVLVLARVPLAPKHLLVVVRVGGQKLVLGVSGDRITPLSVQRADPETPEAPSPTPAPLSTERTTGRPLVDTPGRETAGPPEQEPAEIGARANLLSPGRELDRGGLLDAFSAEDTVTPWDESEPLCREDLEPYRQQVDRLRRLIDSWRGDPGVNDDLTRP